MNATNDLFLLLLNLSQMRSQVSITKLFVECLDALFAPASFRLVDQKPTGDEPCFTIGTRTTVYSYLVPTMVEHLTDEHQTLLHNAIQMLAVILERLELEQQLDTDKSAVEHLASERLEKLEAALCELQQSRNASINLVEDLTLEINDRKLAEAEIRHLNQTLEERVAERTTQLATANQELEAFSYSVSHDLRAPLRAMDGFSAALLEDCTDALDASSLDHLRRIRAGSQRMAVLIDDLLNLSRESRAEMRREPVDVTALVEKIAADLQLANPDRQIELVTAPAMTADADARMLRVVLTNLLGNAWKFSSHRDDARIEVGTAPPETAALFAPAGLWNPKSTVFFVRDNGAGFDMAYAGKLFGAFQRLHSQQEFEGTGIGLALVQRIIRRHGGHVWASGKVNEGATFFFTLGRSEPRITPQT